ncbi:MAG: class A beta-lactamase-related serine hydrolase [Gemmatimonadales bacterium]|nr:class A beta-lactamase-related serine hydrolase [Gemmatimonadales bacterium]
MTRLHLSIALVLAMAAPAMAQRSPAPRRDAALERELAALAAQVRGQVGIYVRHLRTGVTAELRADSTFPTASMVKLPILATLVDRVERGALRWHDTLTYRDSLLYPGEDILGSFRDGARLPLNQAALLMITTSDNTASLWLQQLVGTGAAVNDWLAARGFSRTRVNSRTPGREEARAQYGWGQTTPREMAELLVRIREGRAVGPAAYQEMYRVLTRIYWNGEALSQLPPWVQAAAKQGAVDRSKSEVVLVNGPSGDYVFCVITMGQEDTRWVADNEGYLLLRRVSALLWRTFEPAHPYTPPPEAARWKP